MLGVSSSSHRSMHSSSFFFASRRNVVEYLAGKGIQIDAATLDVLIESAVFELKNGIL